MSQGIFSQIIPTTTSGTDLANILNDFKDAVISGFSGSSRPSELDPGGYWVDTSNPNNWAYKVYTGLTDITIFTVNLTTGYSSITTADTNFEIIKISADTVGPALRMVKERLASNGQTLTGDILGEIQFFATRDSGVNVNSATIKAIATDDTTASAQGTYLSFMISPDASAAMSEAMRLIDGKLGIGITAPSETLHVSNSIKAEKEIEDATSSNLKFRKKRVSTNGQVLANDSIGAIEFFSTDENGAEITSALMEVSARENHSTTAQGSKVVLKNKKLGETTYTSQVTIEDNVTINTSLIVTGDLTVNGSTTTVNTTEVDIEDASITLNKNGNQATANTNKAGFKVEMSDATHARVGYSSTATSKFVVGEVGTEKEIATISDSQTLTNKTLDGANIQNPVRSDVKKDTYSNLNTYASTATDGQLCWATDQQKLFSVKNYSLLELGVAGGIDLSSYPKIRPSVLMDFANSKAIDSRFTFTRNSIGTYVDESGYIRQAATNEPRFDHDPITLEPLGLLKENTATNKVNYSENFIKSDWTKTRCSVQPHMIECPDGTGWGTKLVEDTSASNTHQIEQTDTFSLQQSCFSIFAKAAERSILTIKFNGLIGYFDLINGTATAIYPYRVTITPYKNGWYRCSLRADGIVSTLVYSFGIATSTSSDLYTGDGVSGLYIWGAQVEDNLNYLPYTSYIPSNLTFTSRASVGTHIGSTGLITTQGNDVARFQYNPKKLSDPPKLLIEESSTNYFLQYKTFSDASWVKNDLTVTTSTHTEPDGGANSQRISETATTSEHYFGQNFASFVSGTKYCFSIFAKRPGARKNILLKLPESIFGAGNGGIFDLEESNVVSSTGVFSGVEIFPNGWVRCWVSGTAVSSGAGVSNVYFMDDSYQTNYLGSTTRAFYFWGAQIEPKIFPTSVIPTTTVAVTRAEDITTSSISRTRGEEKLICNGINFSNWYNQYEGSIIFKFKVDSSNNNNILYTFSRDLQVYENFFVKQETTNFRFSNEYNLQNESALITGYIVGEMSTIATSYKTSDKIVIIKDGSTAVETVSNNYAFNNRLDIGGEWTGDGLFTGHISKFAYYPKKLTNVELQTITL